MRRHPALRLSILAALVVGGVVLARATPVGGLLADAAHALAREAHRPWAPFAYVGLYGLAVAAALPGTILTIVGGAAFGLAVGFAVNVAGALVGASLAFVIGRYLARDAARTLFGRHLARLDDLLSGLSSAKRSVWVFFRLRMIPLVPFNGLNFAAGLTETRFLPYLAGTALGILPSTAVYTWFAAELARAGPTGIARSDAAWRVALFLAAFGLVGVAPTLWQRARRRVKSAHGSRQPRRGPLPGASGSDLQRPRGA